MADWESFALAQVGAAAALAGLVFVGVSVNLERVLAEPSAVERVGEALAALVGLLVVASVLLVPGQPRWLVGAELFVIGMIGWVVNVAVQFRARRAWVARQPQVSLRRVNVLAAVHAAFGQLATLPFVVAGAVLLLGSEDGLYGVALAALGSFGLAFLDAWVLLIEIHRVERS